MRRTVKFGVCAALGLSAFLVSPALAQLNQNCTISVLNRTVSVNPDGSWVLPNIPANFGQVKARATCTQNGVTTFGESDFFTVPANGAVNLPAITMGAVTPIPTSLSIAAVPQLTSAGQTAQLAVTAVYPDGSTKDVTSSATGTNFTISNPAIATITADGLVTAVSSGTVVIQANNDGATGIITVPVVFGGASVGGIPVSWLLQYGLNPNDSLVAMEDPDRDGLTNLKEFQNGTDPTNPDTDGDGLNDGDEVNRYHTKPLLADTDGDKIPDGVEVQTGTNPLDRTSYDLRRATAKSTVTPPSFTLNTGAGNPQLSVQLDWKVSLIDGKTTLDLTNDPRTSYASSNLNVCSFGQQPGLIFSGNTGTCTITISQNTLSLVVPGTVTSFTPTELSTLSIPGAVAVDIGGSFAYVAAGTSGLVVVDVNDRANPHVRSTLSNLGDAEGVRVSGQFAYVADATGFLRVVNAQNPDMPVSVSSLAIRGNPIALAIHGTMAAIAAQTGGVAMVNVTDPPNPTLIGTVATSASALGVDFDPPSGLLAIALGTSGLQLVDISHPTTPKLRGLLAGGDVRRVLLRLPAALLADAQRSITSANVSNPDQPTLSSSLPSNLGGVPVDIAAYGNIGMTADTTFGKATPIINISNALQPSSVGFWQWQSNPGYGSSIALDLAYAYLILGSNNVLRILQYQDIVDTFGVPPTVSITSPTQGATLIRGEPITFAVNANDDVAVASVSFLVDGQTVYTTSATPYQFQYTVPAEVTMLIFGATAVDFGGNVGVAQNFTVNVIPDPLTTATGKIVSPRGTPVRGATVTILSHSTTSASDGTFSISGLSTIKGNLIAQAFAVLNGVKLFAQSNPVPPVVGGATNIGTLTLAPAPIIASLTPRAAIAGTTVTGVKVTGSNLLASTFALNPPGLTVSSAVIDPSGAFATMNVSIPSTSSGRYVLVATNPAGSSSTIGSYLSNEFVVPGTDGNADPDGDGLTNTLEIQIGTDPLNIDTDGDGYPDGVEHYLGSNPLDPNSIPSPGSFAAPGYLTFGFSVLNNVNPSSGQAITEQPVFAFSLLNMVNPAAGQAVTEQPIFAFSVLNAINPSVAQSVLYQPIFSFSLLNAVDPSASTATLFEPNLLFSVLNQANQSNTVSPALPLSSSAQLPAVANAGTPVPSANATPTNPQGESAETLARRFKSASLVERWLMSLQFSGPDIDGDGIPDALEVALGLDPFNPDTDRDGIPDGVELMLGTDPLDPRSAPSPAQLSAPPGFVGARLSIQNLSGNPK